jgi:hypothetical protein
LTLSAVAEVEEHAGNPVERMTRFCYRLATIVVENGRYRTAYWNETYKLHVTDRKAMAFVRGTSPSTIRSSRRERSPE